MTEPHQSPAWTIERRGSDFALVRTDDRSQTELPMTETDVFVLSRMFQSYAGALIASKTRSDVEAWLTVRATGFMLNSDIHNGLLLLMIRDETEAEFGFAFLPEDARQLAASLTNWADRMDQVRSPSGH